MQLAQAIELNCSATVTAGGPGSGRHKTGVSKQQAETHKALSKFGLKAKPNPWGETNHGETHVAKFISPGTEKYEVPHEHQIFTHPNGSWVHEEPFSPTSKRGRVTYAPVPGSEGKMLRGKDAASLARHLSDYKAKYNVQKFSVK